MSIGQTDMTWLQVLQQLEHYTHPDVYDENWRLGYAAKEELRKQLKEHSVRVMGS